MPSENLYKKTEKKAPIRVDGVKFAEEIIKHGALEKFKSIVAKDKNGKEIQYTDATEEVYPDMDDPPKRIVEVKELGKKSNLISNDEVVEPLKYIVEKVLRKAGQIDHGLKIKIDSKIPVGVGLGSSASTAVSTTFAWLSKAVACCVTTDFVS